MRGRRSSWRVSCGVVTKALFLSALFTAWGGEVAHAYPNYHPNYATYGLPAWVEGTCTNCHVSIDGGGGCTGGAPCFNNFGRQYRQFASWGSISGSDADGDGISNAFDDTADEGGPGFPQGANEVACDMLACANAYGSFVNCADANNFIRCSATRGSISPSGVVRYYFTFAFQCQSSGHWGYSPTIDMSDEDWGDRCYNTNECGSATACLQNYAANSCTNQNPGFDCSCGTGFSLVNNETINENCADVNECNTTHAGVTAGQRCNQHLSYGTCSNTVGAYSCSCNTGYVTSGSGHSLTCSDVNECSTTYNGVSPSARCNNNLGYGTCSNTTGGYSCACNTGYVTSGSGQTLTCTDVNECSTTYGGVTAGQRCNQHLSYGTCSNTDRKSVV